MVGSSNNYELFLQSRHPVATVDVLKVGSSTRSKEDGGTRPKEEKLLQIN